MESYRPPSWNALKGTLASETHVDPSVAGKLFSRVAESTTPSTGTVTADLSERKREVLELLAQGFTNSSIPRGISLTRGTVRD